MKVSILFLFKRFHIINPPGKVFKGQMDSFNPKQVGAKLMKSFVYMKLTTFIPDHTLLVAFIGAALSEVIA